MISVLLLLVATTATGQTGPPDATPTPRQSNGPLTVTRVNESGERKSKKSKKSKKSDKSKKSEETEKPHPAGSVYKNRIAVRVVDEIGRPVPEAEVTFKLPQPDHPAVLTDGYRSGPLPPTVVRTDIEGVADICSRVVEPPGIAASAPAPISKCPLRANRLGGEVSIDVTVDFHGETGSTRVTELNKAPGLLTKRRAIMIGAAAAGVLIPVILLRSPHATISTVSPTGPVTGR